MAGKENYTLLLPYEAGCKTSTADFPSSRRQLPVPQALDAKAFTLLSISGKARFNYINYTTICAFVKHYVRFHKKIIYYYAI